MPQLELLTSEDKNPLDLAYIAGLFDGEGTITITKVGQHYSLAVRIQMNTTESIELCRQIFRGKFYKHKQREPYPDAYVWNLGGKSAYYFLKVTLPFLRAKAKEAKVAIEFWDRYWLPGRNKPSQRRIEIGELYRSKMNIFRHINRRSK